MILSNYHSIGVRQITHLYIKTEQYHREADFAKIFRNIVNFRVNVRIHMKITYKYFLLVEF